VSDSWLEILDDSIDAADVRHRIRERIAARGDLPPSWDIDEDPIILADRLRKQMIDPDTEDDLPIREGDCDIVPRNYVIDWRVPIIGPIHAVVRRIINAEIRRYLSSSLEKQSYFNRQMLRVLKGLVEENKRLRHKVEELREDQG
jgi:hypothetical protein